VIIGGEEIGGRADDPVDKLEKLARLRDAGVVNEQEFQSQKARILGEST
jgi:hypothetical protein